MLTSIVLTTAAIEIPPLELPDQEVGASVEFAGIVRQGEGDQRIAGLFYEAYAPMARKQLETIARELVDRFPCKALSFVHRLGWVPVGECSLWIRVLASHRAEAFAFSSALIDQLKTDVPIWKRTR